MKKPKDIKPQTEAQKVASDKKAGKTDRIVKHLKNLDRTFLIAFLTEFGKERMTGNQLLTILYDDEANSKLDAGSTANDAMVKGGGKKTKMDGLKKKSDKRMGRE